MSDISKKDLFDVIKYGHIWHIDRIKDELEKIISNSSSYSHMEIRWDGDEKIFYVFELDCYLFVDDGVVSVRSDRDNTPSTDVTTEYRIKTVDDIKNSFRHFTNLTREGDDA